MKLTLLIFNRSCRFDVSDCVKKSVEFFNSWMFETEPDHINP
jgi:hypothetical protein